MSESCSPTQWIPEKPLEVAGDLGLPFSILEALGQLGGKMLQKGQGWGRLVAPL